MYGGWKGELLSQLRATILQAAPGIVEEVKWEMPSRPWGLPVWSHQGIVSIAETFKNDIKLVFFKGALLDDPKKLFNARLMSKTDRAIEYHEGEAMQEEPLAKLIIEATMLNEAKSSNKKT